MNSTHKKLTGYTILGGIFLLLIVSVWMRACQTDETRQRLATIPTKKVGTDLDKPMPGVEFPGIGFVAGRISRETLIVKDTDGTVFEAAPETLILDDEGNFLYLRNRLPQIHTTRKTDNVEKMFRKYFTLHLESIFPNKFKGDGESFRILGPGKISLDSTRFRAQLIEASKNDWSDYEIWSVRVFNPGCGEVDALLTANLHPQYKGIVWSQGAVREWRLDLPESVPPESVPDFLSGPVEIAEPWEVPPAKVSEENRYGFIWDGEIVDYDTFCDIQKKLGKKVEDSEQFKLYERSRKR